MKGFGSTRASIRLVSVDMFGLGKECRVGEYQGKAQIEIKSAARLVEKEAQRIVDWASRNQVTLCRGEYGTEKFFCIGSHDFISYVMYEANECDNPYAQQVLDRTTNYGLNAELRRAQQEGRDWVMFPNGAKVRFEMIDGQPWLDLEGVAASVGMSKDEAFNAIQSPEFQSHIRTSEGWR